MVSAVFHSPLEATQVPGTPRASAPAVTAAAATPMAKPVQPPRDPFDWRGLGDQPGRARLQPNRFPRSAHDFEA